MATYKKPLKAFMATTLMGLSARAMDTADGKRLGSYAIDAFEAHKTITAEDGDKKVLVPFHAIKTAMYGTMTEDTEKADAYCGGGTEPVGEVWATITSATGQITLQSDGTKEEREATTNKQYADWLNMFNNPSNYEVKANMSCGEGSMEYIDVAPQRFLYEDEGYSVGIMLSQGTITVGADQKDDCVPIEIIVTKK